MSGHFTAENIERYRSRQMPAAELLAADDHLAVCDECRLKAAATVKAEAMFTFLRNNLHVLSGAEATHLSYEQIAALVDNQITGAARETIEEHIKLCAPCAEEVRDLSAFKSTLAVTAAAQPTRAAASPTSAERFAAFWRSQWSLPQFATAAVVLLAAAAAIMLFVWKPSDLTQTELAQRGPDPTTPIVQPSSSPVTSETPRPSIDAMPDNAAPVRPDDSLPPPPSATDSSAEVVIALNDGGRITLDRSGNVTGLAGLSPASQQAIKTALTTGAVKTPRGLAELAHDAGTLMGNSAVGVAFPPVSPVGVVVRTDRPTLRWQPLSGATSYTVTLLDSRMNVAATSPPLTATHWTMPRTLTRGGTYTWQVTVVKDGREIISPAAPAPEAKFKVLEGTKARELERMERAKVNSHLTRGVLYAEAGLLDYAEQEFTALLKANPRSSVAQKLLRSTQAQRQEGKVKRK